MMVLVDKAIADPQDSGLPKLVKLRTFDQPDGFWGARVSRATGEWGALRAVKA